MKQIAKRSKRKDWSKWEERLPLIMAFMIPLFIGIVVCIDHGVYPFGDRSILKVDMYHQYAPFFSELREKLQNGESLMYSFDIGLGSERIRSKSLSTLAIASSNDFRRASITF